MGRFYNAMTIALSCCFIPSLLKICLVILRLLLSLSLPLPLSLFSILHFDVFIGFIETLGPEDQSNDDDGRPPQNEEENGGGSIINIPA